MPNTEKPESKAVKEFSRFAHHYNTYNMIQSEVARVLVSQIPSAAAIVDIGCGSGEVYKHLELVKHSFDEFIALDSSQEMLNMHPSSTKITKICADFNAWEIDEILPSKLDTLLISSSALQWSKDLDFTLSILAKKFKRAHFAIFTSSTFKTLHQVAKIDSPIYAEALLKEKIQKYYKAKFETKEYRLYFENVTAMFNYIKKSGVSGGERKLSYRQTKQLMLNYPLDYLEFEVLFVKADSLL